MVSLNIMDVFDAINRRRSVRRYTGEPVSDDDLQTIIAAGMMAPSAGNQQPWHFIIATGRELLRRVGEINPNAVMAAAAPAALLVCGDSGEELYPGYWVQDCSAAVQNMLLAAHALNLGAVWTGIWPRTDRTAGFRELFNLPESVNPLALLVIGHPAEGQSEGAVPNRFKPERIHREHW